MAERRRACVAQVVCALLATTLVAACAAGEGAQPTTAPAQPADPPAAVAALPPQSPTPAPDPRKFVGMNPGEVTAMLGEPSFRRRDPPAEVWQYRSGTCVLDLFFYSDGREKPAYAVTHAEVRMRGSAKRADAECLGRIVRERNATPTS